VSTFNLSLQIAGPYTQPMAKRRETRLGRPPRKEGESVLINFRATADEREAYQRAAEAAGMSLSDWIRSLADRELKRKEK
jgi:predicted HicB family RNase H-like nuclease